MNKRPPVEPGSVYSRLTVVRAIGKNGFRDTYWQCRCQCGKETTSLGSNLRRGLSRSCGCLGRSDDIQPGQQYGRWTVLREVEQIGYVRRWQCRCACGNEGAVIGANLRRGGSRSCGCLTIEAATTHGQTNTSTYAVWKGMLDRCYNKNAPKYSLYGGTGVRVCSEWRNSFENFLADMAERPQNKSLDRWPDRGGDYSLSNCRWATPTEQNRNRRNIQLDDDKVRAIKNDPRRQSVIAADYGVHQSEISRIKSGKRWRLA